MNTKFAATLAMALMLSGCIASRPQGFAAKVPTQTVPLNWQTELPNAAVAQSSLRQLVDAPDLQALITRALADNPGLRETALRLREANLAIGRDQADLFPQASVSADASRSQSAATKEGRDGPANTVSASLSLSWEVDVWGRLQNRLAASELEADAMVDDVRAARTVLIGKIMRQWIDKAATDQIVAVEEARIRSLRLAETVITGRYDNGLGDIGDLDAARSATASAEATLAARQDDSARIGRRLLVLSGQMPGTISMQASGIPDVTLPGVETPAAVIGRRPDLLAAYARLKAADQTALYTYKDILPHFKLSGSVDGKADSLPNLLRLDPAWSLISALSAPLFDAGQRKAQTEIAETTAERQWELYRAGLLTAVEEVENALALERNLARQTKSRVLARQHARAAYQHQTEKYAAGLSDVVSLLTSERTAFDAEIAVLEVQQNRMRNRVTLALALGFDD